jgi:hypothetical protein
MKFLVQEEDLNPFNKEIVERFQQMHMEMPKIEIIMATLTLIA